MFKTLLVDPRICYQNSKLFANQTIPAQTILIKIAESECISINQIPKQFISMVKNNPQKIKYLKNNDQTILLLYLIHLKIFNSQQYKCQKKLFFYDYTIGIWLNSSTTGFIGFQESIIRLSNDLDLLIEYIAYKNHVEDISRNLYKLYIETQDQKNKQIFPMMEYQKWKQLCIWGLQFKNTRSFGITKYTTLIPWMDYLNYHPHANQQTILMYGSNQQIQQNLNDINQLKSQLSSQSQSDEDSNSCRQQKREQVNSQNHNYYLLSKKIINKDSQIFLNYGSMSNQYFLKWYGFVHTQNPKNYLNIYIDTYNSIAEQIKFNKLEKSYIRIKLKDKQINYNLLKIVRKQYYQQFYRKKLSNFIWSIPLSKEYQIYILSKLLSRLKKYNKLPKGNWIHQNEQVKYIKLHQEEQQKIYNGTIQIIQLLISWVEQKITQQQLKQIVINSLQYMNTYKKVTKNYQ